MTRTGDRKGGATSDSPAKSKKAKGKKRAVSEEESEAAMSVGSEDESSELSDLVSDAEIEASSPESASE